MAGEPTANASVGTTGRRAAVAGRGPAGDGRQAYHAGEILVQRRAGVHVEAGRIGRSIRAAMPPVARELLAGQRWLVASHPDVDGQPWARTWTGPRGFVAALDERSLTVRPATGLEAGAPLRVGDPLGLLAMDLSDRRRMRVNGRIHTLHDKVVELNVEQAYSNCPKYIQTRTPIAGEWSRDPGTDVRRSDRLIGSQAGWIERADTFFIATAHPSFGADASHRGGMPGFVRVESPRRIAWPDYRGNSMFNTLGNLEVEPRAALLFIDFERGDLLHLTGRAEVDWGSPRVTGLKGAERAVVLEIGSVIERREAFPLRMALGDYSPHNPR